MLIFFLITGCQLNQSVNLIKGKLFSETDEPPTVEVSQTNIEEDIKSEIKDEENKKISREIKELERENSDVITEDVSRESDSQDKEVLNKINKQSTNQILAFKEMGKARDNESKIISFFTKIFDNEDDLTSAESEKSLLNKEEDNKQIRVKQGSFNELDKKSKVSNTASKEEMFEEGLSKKSKEDSIEESSYQITTIDEDEIDSEEALQPEDRNGNEESFAFLNLKPKVRDKKVLEESEARDNLVGLLLPLTGQKSSAGDLVINSLRYSMLLKPYQLDFKIFDTKGTPEGSILAAKQGIENNVKTFIGPIFSDETREVRNFFKKKKDLTFFSLSPDFNNVSENVIVSGQNPDDQIACITKHIVENKKADKTLLIYHEDKYGEVIKNSFTKYINNYGITQFMSLEFFEINKNINLNDEIRKLSRFEDRKLRLSREIKKITNDSNLDSDFRESQIKSLERKLTIDSPFDSIIIASEGDKLLEILSHLAFYDINSENTNIYGTGLWEDTEKKDNVFRGAFYASSLKEKKIDFIKDFRNVFSKDPMSFNFHMHDLLELVQNYKNMNKKEKENKVFLGEFSNSRINSGLLQREIFIKRIKNSLDTTEVFNCQLNVL